MDDVKENRISMALRHVFQGRERVEEQYRLISRLRAGGHPTEDAERVLEWLLLTQDRFESHYRALLHHMRGRVNGSRDLDPTFGWVRN